MHTATLAIEIGGPIAKAVEGALSVEAGAGMPKVTARLERTEKEVLVNLVAEDMSALRAAINSFLRWVTMAADVASGAGPVQGSKDKNQVT